MNKKLSKVFAIVLAMMLCLTMAVPAFAATPVLEENGNAVLKFTSTLHVNGGNLSEGVKPSISYELAGVGEADITTGLEKTTYTAEFSNANTSPEISIDFSQINFNAIGVYHYKLTQANLSAPYSLHKTEVADSAPVVESGVRYIDVHVVYNKDHVPAIQTVLMYMTDDNKEVGNKNGEFENDYDVVDLEVKKTVSGNQGEHDKKFKFTIEITGALEGAYDIEGSDKKLEVGANGEGSVEVELTHNQSIKIKDLPKGASYTITEQEAADYKTKIGGELDADKKTEGKLDVDTTVAYENIKDGDVPTGILLTIAPFVALMLIGAAGVLFVVLKKRSK